MTINGNKVDSELIVCKFKNPGQFCRIVRDYF